MRAHQKAFLELALACDVLRFGKFTLKSGRTSPYFFNAGNFNSGAALAALGRHYAQTVVSAEIEFDQVFGPAYKGIPLGALTVAALADQHGLDKGFVYNRKEAKAHGEGGTTVGAPLAGKVLIVDDVITAGTAIREAVHIIRSTGAEVAGVVIALDRCERGRGATSAVRETEQSLGIRVASIVRLHDLIAYLEESDTFREHLDAVRIYRDEYGV